MDVHHADNVLRLRELKELSNENGKKLDTLIERNLLDKGAAAQTAFYGKIGAWMIATAIGLVTILEWFYPHK